jgi:secreted trypsin-like serine protease
MSGKAFHILLLMAAISTITTRATDLVCEGEPATEEESSAVGYLHIKEGYQPSGDLDRNTNSCTATLLSPSVVLTAAHCVAGYYATRVQFTLDPHPTSHPFAHYAQAIEIRMHPDWGYNTSIGKNDLALVRLGYGSYGAEPHVYPKLSWAPRPDPLRPARLRGIGYGQRIDYERADKRAVDLAFSQARELASGLPYVPRYAGAPGFELYPAQSGEVICHGDSGGPLFATVLGGTHLVGVLSGGYFGRDQGRCAMSAIYTALDPDTLNWIRVYQAKLETRASCPHRGRPRVASGLAVSR